MDRSELAIEPLLPVSSPVRALGLDGLTRFIAVAPNGGRLTTREFKCVPTSPDSLADAAYRCCEAGASMMHVHVRDSSQNHILNVDAYDQAFSSIRSKVGDALILQMTTEALGKYNTNQQTEIVRQVRPESASLAYRELVRNEASAEQFYELLVWMKSAGVSAQIILYDIDDLRGFVSFLADFGLAPEDTSVLFAIGRYSSEIAGLTQLIEYTKVRSVCFRDIMVCAFGREEAPFVTAGALFGASARVGFENNRFLPDGSAATCNSLIVKNTQAIFRSIGFRIGSSKELRALWGL